MTIQECYTQLGGDYAQVTARLPSAALVERFLKKFPDDGSYAELCRCMEAGNRADAFRAAHTLKGVCGNLSLNRLYDSASQLTELLRHETDSIGADAAALMETVKQDYALTADAIRSYFSQI